MPYSYEKGNGDNDGFSETHERTIFCQEFQRQERRAGKLDTILEAGNNAPTATNAQPQRMYGIRSDEARAKVKRIIQYHHNAPCFLLVCYNEEESWFGPINGFGSIDATIVGTHMMLEATELRPGSVWVAAFHPGIAKQEFDLPGSIVRIALIPIGYPSDRAQPNPRHTVRRAISETGTYV